MKELIFLSVLGLTFAACVTSYVLGAAYGRAAERIDAMRRWEERQVRWREFDDT